MKFDTVIIGGGESGLKKGMQKLAVGNRVAIITAGISTISIRHAACDIENYITRLNEGIKIEADMKREFRTAGGVLLYGDEVLSAELASADNGEMLVKSVKTRKLEGDEVKATEFYLATGSFVSRGLKSSYCKISEPIFNLDIEDAPPQSEMADVDFFAPQAFMRVHVATDSKGHALKGGKAIVNLFPIGSIATGYPQPQKL